MDPFLLAGYNEEDAAALAAAAAKTGIATEELIAALSGFMESFQHFLETAYGLDTLARTSRRIKRCARGKKQIPPKSLGNIKYTAARPPARPARYPIQRGRKR